MVQSALLSLQQKVKQAQFLMMSSEMQQAINLLQLPATELAITVTEHLEQNPIAEIAEDSEEESEEEQNQEPDEDLDLLDNPLSFREDDFEIMRRLDDDFRNNMTEESPYHVHRTAEEKEYQGYLEQSICAHSTLFEHLMQQANETFECENERTMAEAIIGNFNENGYLQTPLHEIALLNNFSLEKLQEVLFKIHSFEPHGIGAATLQESLLNQLRLQGKQNTLATHIISNHYDDLLHNRLPAIQKSLKCTPQEIADAINHDLLHLDLHPGTSYSHEPVQAIIPDVTLRLEGEELLVDINHDFMPPLRLNTKYRKMVEDPELAPDTKEFILKKIASFKWLLRNIHQRGDTLTKIAQSLTKKQKQFFLDPEGELLPWTMKELAEELDLHESTIARAVANKYINTPRGLLPLRFFFSSSYLNDEGHNISSDTVRKAIKELIQNEDKKQPFSDKILAKHLKENGIICARRTIAKYRGELKLGNAQQRRKF
jgi:RNA polymerase sigma-54 factor